MMLERTLVRAMNSAVRAAVIAGFVGYGVCILFMLLKFSSHPDLFEPYPLFGGSLAWLHWMVAVIYAGIWLAWTLIILRQVAAGVFMSGFVAFLMLVAGVGAGYGLNCANALLDFSSPVRTPILVRGVNDGSGKTIRGASLTVMATVSPLDRRDQRFKLNWNSCGVSPDDISPFAFLRIGRGLFGAPWVALPVECRALAVADRPLFGTFRLGSSPVIVATVERGEGASVRAMRDESRSQMLEVFQGFIDGSPSSDRGQAEFALKAADLALLKDGRAQLRKLLAPLLSGDPQAKEEDIGRAAIRIVNEDLRRQDPVYLLTLWKQGIDTAAPEVPIAIIRSDNGAGILTDFQCSRCSMLSEDTVDMDIYRLFAGDTARGLGGNQIFLLDAAGRVTFKADLSDTALVPRLAQSVKAVAAKK